MGTHDLTPDKWTRRVAGEECGVGGTRDFPLLEVFKKRGNIKIFVYFKPFLAFKESLHQISLRVPIKTFLILTSQQIPSPDSTFHPSCSLTC